MVATRELLMLSTPAAEDLFRENLLAAVTAEQDNSFINPLNGGVADTKPASITNPVTPITSAGSPDEDIAALFAAYTGDWETAFLVVNGKVGARLASVTMPNVGARGGEVKGVPVITSSNCPPNIIVMVDAAGLAYFEEGAGMDKSEHSRSSWTALLPVAPVLRRCLCGRPISSHSGSNCSPTGPPSRPAASAMSRE